MTRLLASLLLIVSFPLAASAAEPAARLDGFLHVWETLRRPAEAVRGTTFTDLFPADRGFFEVAFAERRGLLDEAESFRPAEPLGLQDLAIWLLRTRNVAAPDEVTVDTLSSWLERYPFVDVSALGGVATMDDVRSLTETLDRLLKEEVHLISNYGEELRGEGPALGQKFDPDALTAAHPTLPYNTLIRVTNPENGKSVVVRINDRGPFVHGRDLDLSAASFRVIAGGKTGMMRATIERLGDVRLVGGCGDDGRRQVRITKGVRLDPGVPHVLALGDTLTLRSAQWFVVRGVLAPDGGVMESQDWIQPGDPYEFTPSLEGEYRFRLGTAEGRGREMAMRVVRCGA